MSKDDFDASKWIIKTIMLDPTIGLYRTSDIEDISVEKGRVMLRSLVDNKDPLKLAFASMLNAIFTQQAPVFMITKRSLSKLIYDDKNHDGTLCHNRVYTVLMGSLKESGFLEVIEEPAPRKAGLYRIKDQDAVEVLKLIMIDKPYEEIEKMRTDKYYKMNEKNQDSEDAEDLEKIDKYLEKYRESRKKSS